MTPPDSRPNLRLRALFAFAALLASLIVPALATAANPVGGILGEVSEQLQGTGDGPGGANGGGGPAPAPAPDPDPEPQNVPGGDGYTPPAHGENPHATGTVATVDLTPDPDIPYSGDPANNEEDVVLGSSESDYNQNSEEYSGQVTVLSLFGNEILGIDTNESEDEGGPLSAIQEGVLDELCVSSGGLICVEVLDMNSTTTEEGSSNDFTLAQAVLLAGNAPTGVGVADSSSVITDDGECQTASAQSTVADVDLLGTNAADVAHSENTAEACTDGSSSTEGSSSVIGLVGQGVPIPASGCADGTPNTAFTTLAPIATTVCNAVDDDGDQLNIPYIVSEALTAFVLELGDTAQVKGTTASSESAAVAPPDDDSDDDGTPDDEDDCPNQPGPPQNNGCPDDDGDNDNDDDGIPNDEDDCPNQAGPASNNGCPDNDQDDDGVPDDEDNCPNTPGPASNDGCPLDDDDGDGILDDDDACPVVPGPASNDGCPLGDVGDDEDADTDGDGLVDSEDSCPTEPGPISNDGCPTDDDALAFTGGPTALIGLIGLATLTMGVGLEFLRRRTRSAVA